MAEAERKTREKGGALHTIANVIGIVLCVVFIPVIILNMVLIVKSYTNPDKLPTVFGVAPVIVLSGSMWPEFNAGDMIFVQKEDPDALQEGDVICYFVEGPETAITHRIMEIQDQGGQKMFVTKGDANNVEDSIAVTADMVQGKYMGFYIGGLGSVAVFLQSPQGMLLCIGVPLVLIFLWDLFRRLRASRRNKGTTAAIEEKNQAMEEELERLRAQVAEQQASVEKNGNDGQGPASGV